MKRLQNIVHESLQLPITGCLSESWLNCQQPHGSVISCQRSCHRPAKHCPCCSSAFCLTQTPLGEAQRQARHQDPDKGAQPFDHSLPLKVISASVKTAACHLCGTLLTGSRRTGPHSDRPVGRNRFSMMSGKQHSFET